MSNLQNIILEENAHDKFVIELCDNNKFASEVAILFYTSEELWREKEYGRPEEEAQDRAFEKLLKWDYELTVLDPIKAVEFFAIDQYVRRK